MNTDLIRHPFDPVYSKEAEILILGSFPSVKSRENEFYYGHERNRFWKVLSAVYSTPVPLSTEEKIDLLHNNRIALWDVAAACTVNASADSSIKRVIANDIGIILQEAKIKAVYANGKTAEKLYNKLILPQTGISIKALPSTSPANASFSFDKLLKEWSQIKEI